MRFNAPVEKLLDRLINANAQSGSPAAKFCNHSET